MHSVSSYIQNEHAQTGCGGSGALQGLLNVFVHVISGVRAQAADDQIKAAQFYLTGWGPVPIPPSLGKQASLKSLIFWGEIAAVLNMQPDSELWCSDLHLTVFPGVWRWIVWHYICVTILLRPMASALCVFEYMWVCLHSFNIHSKYKMNKSSWKMSLDWVETMTLDTTKPNNG